LMELIVAVQKGVETGRINEGRLHGGSDTPPPGARRVWRSHRDGLRRIVPRLPMLVVDVPQTGPLYPSGQACLRPHGRARPLKRLARRTRAARESVLRSENLC
jgi:hypothetical protein